MSRILVTGATGLIGRFCAKHLAALGLEVHLAARASLEQHESDNFHAIDLLRSGAAGELLNRVRPELLLHLAWRSPRDSLEHFHWVNASLELLFQFHAAGGRRVVFAGTCAEYGWEEGAPLSEQSPLRPATQYGVCRKSLYELFFRYTRDTGISAAWPRIFFVYGPGEHQDRFVPVITNALLNHQPARLSHARQIRDYLYVEDVASAIVRVACSELQGAINIGSGAPVALRQIAIEIGDQLGHPELLEFGAVSARADDAPTVAADITRLTGELNWRPQFDLSRGIGRSIEYWQKERVDET